MVGNALGDFLREQRKCTPAKDRGIGGAFGHLRRQDVAVRAGISTSYYTQLEQGRRHNPSAAVLSRLAEVFDLGPAGRASLFALAAEKPPVETVRPPSAAEKALTAFEHVPAMVADNALDIVRSNRLWQGLHTQFTTTDNIVRMVFTDAAAKRFFVDWAAIADEVITSLRRSHQDPAVAQLVMELTAASDEFARRWEHAARVVNRSVHRVNHAVLGQLEFAHEVFTVPGVPGWSFHVLLPPHSSPTEQTALLLELFDSQQ